MPGAPSLVPGVQRASAGRGGGSPSRWGPPGFPQRFRPGATGFSNGRLCSACAGWLCLWLCLFTALFVYAFNSPMTAEDTPAANAPVCLVTRVHDTWKEPFMEAPCHTRGLQGPRATGLAPAGLAPAGLTGPRVKGEPRRGGAGVGLPAVVQQVRGEHGNVDVLPVHGVQQGHRPVHTGRQLKREREDNGERPPADRATRHLQGDER